MTYHRKTKAVINLGHLQSNLDFLRKHNGEQVFFCPMIKANAYGHGDIEIAQFLQQAGVKNLGVGQVEEGIRLREAGIKTNLLCFSHFDTAGAQAMLEQDISPVLLDREQLELFTKCVQNSKMALPVNVHIKFDSGMNRVGFALESESDIISHFSKYPGVLRLRSVLTHLKKGEDAGEPDGVSIGQLQKFMKVIETLQAQKKLWGCDFEVHALNSAALLQKRDLERNLVSSVDLGARPGLSIYGYSPLTGLSTFLRPILSLQSHWVSIRFVKKGESVSYGGTWTAWQDSWVGVLPYGYADGYPRRLGNRSSVLVMGLKASVVGNVCMDYVMVDVTEAVSRKGFDLVRQAPVTLLGEDEFGNFMGAHELATYAGTATWEILTSIAERIPREFIKGPESA